MANRQAGSCNRQPNKGTPMKFALVLLILGWRLRWLAWRDAGFRKQLENRDVVMQWRTFNGKPARSFHFTPGMWCPKAACMLSPPLP